MFTDIKSFSKKMSENEELAMQLLRIHDDTLKSIIEKYEGKIIKAIGDAFMVDFSSAVNAVKCATEAQEAFHAHNEGKSELEKIEVRIGIHLGDVITDGNDIFGDGVNIASRIEAVTEPNRICISQDVYSQIKNKMQLKTFHMGSISLKNIAEPVEVYEILLDSIPEFSVPSRGAQQMPTKRAAEKVTKKEAKEAEHVEATRRKADEEREKAEREAQEKVQRLYEKAQGLVEAGKLPEAERELNEIFKVVAFHAGAQVLQARIEEAKEKKADEERRHGAARKKIEQRINELLTEALSMVEKDNFTEASLKIKEIFSLDPGNTSARDLEVQITEAQKAKEELERRRAEADVALPQEPAPPEPVPEVAEAVPEEQKAPPPPKKAVGLRQPKKRLSPTVRNTIAVVVGLGVLAVLFPQIEKLIVPHDRSVVIIPFQVRGGSDSTLIGSALASLIAEDLSAYPELVVIRPGAPPDRPVDPMASAREAQARYIVTGQILSFYPKLVLRVSLGVSDVQATLWERTIESEPFALTALRSEIASNIFSTLELELDPKEIPSLSQAPLVNMQYLMGIGALERLRRDEAVRAVTLFRQVTSLDSMLGPAYVALGRAYLRLYKTEGERDKGYLREAVDAALVARTINAALPGVHEVLGSAYRSAGRYSQALQNLTQGIELQPGNAECYRQLAQLSLAQGDYDQALRHGSKAVLLDPRHPDSHEVMGHVFYFKQQYNSAQESYDRAIGLGSSPFLITSRYKIAVWGAGLSPEPVAEYGSRLLKEDSTNAVVKYWIGRAYMLSGFWTQAKGYLESGAEQLKVTAEKNPDDPAVRGLLALYHARLGESALGIAQADRALELSGESALALYRKAQFFAIQTDKKIEALEWLKKAVEAEFILWEVMSPDFAFISKDPEFKVAMSVRIPAGG